MARSGSAEKSPPACNVPRPTPEDDRKLDRLSWRNWFMIVGVSVLTTIGLATGVLSAVRERVAQIWPWANTDVALMIGLSTVMLLFTAYLTIQQRHLGRLRRRLRWEREAANLRMRQHCDRLFSLLTVSRAVGTETDPETVFEVITRSCLDTFDGEQVSLMLLDRASGLLEVRAATGHKDPHKVLGARTQLGEGIAGWVGENRKPLLLGKHVDTSRYPGFKPKGYAINAAMVVPIEVRGELVGVLNVSSRSENRDYGEDDLQALQVFAENAGIAVRHAEQANWMRETIQRLDNALAQRDAEKAA
jgi:putative methionine-R-sulfoxide reductase with GAF domain